MSECPSSECGTLSEEKVQRALVMLNIEFSETLSKQDKCKLLQDNIMNTDNLPIMFDIMDVLSVSSKGAATVQEMRERINIQLMSKESCANDEMKSLVAAKSEFKRNKEKLSKLYEKYIDILNTTFPCMINHLTSEDIIANAAKNIQETQNALNDTQCTIIFTGETGAGKSTLLNVILRDSVLPHHAISCTSTICMIKYGEKRHMKVRYNNGQVKEFDIEDNEESRTKIEDALFQRADREKGSDIRSVELQLPSQILNCGLIFVDTPGIGENDAMEEILTNFIREHQIQGFIYVVKVDGAAGGIQEDRILKLMKIVIEKQNYSKSNHTETCLYDTATTLFVFNRWDLVSDEDKIHVRDYVEKRLKKCSPNIDDNEIMFMSATSVMRQLENGFVTTPYTELIKGIRQMMEKTAFIILKRFYRWLNYMVSRSLHHYKTLFSGADFSEYQLKQKFRETERKLNILEANSKEIFQELRKNIDDKEAELNENLSEYLQSEMIWAEITNLTESEMEFARQMQNFDSVVSNLYNTKIIDAISEYTPINQEINQLKDKLMLTIKKKTFLLQEELSIIELEMDSKDMGILNVNNRRGSNFSICSWHLPMAPPKIPSTVLGKLALSAKRLLTKHNSKNALRKQVQRGSKDALDSFIRENNYIACQLEPIRNYLEKAEVCIPKLIESNKSFIAELKENHLKHKLEKEKYIEALNKILELQDEIAHFGYQNTFNQKKALEKLINIQSLAPSFTNSIGDSGIVVDTNRRVPQSLFAEMIPAALCDTEITIRKYFRHLEIPSLYSEIEKLSYLHHESLAKVIQAMKGDEPVPVILFDERLFPLRWRTNNITQRKRIPVESYSVFIRNIASGLVYIHSHGLVHPEVSLDSVMVNWHQQVKLTGMALPRKLTIVDSDQPIQDMVYLAPEVLRGGIYESPADVFGFGLLICELYIKKRAFGDKTRLSISRFLNEVDATNVEYFELIPDNLKGIVPKMLSSSPSERLTSSNIWRTLEI
ncbi:uncharacterized protein LOC106877344 [Octopus bimaculoides]|uniref:Protein kinase domain-containing protein n=1 Tax=Octopus bimaculoides TaxID=37653 RepID=A0A0L8GEP5_OCTBM|nr:uncharacterized protein LOC106877344 [Octopus bimaculoides]XP_014781711.1 uncharacterized protein LOC106877344 [Octopus bimaculoides]|eukprot:XP_014781710.1 PREDICTED: uncharacterized protein LOC106877344 [Octopus bimaculoides]